MDAELAFHFDERIAELVEGGMSSDEARGAVPRVSLVMWRRCATGLVAIDGRIARRGRQREWWQSVGQDAGYVVRVFRRSPGFLAAVALTLALGIGVNTAIFSILDRLYLQAPPGVVQPGGIRRIIRLNRAPGTAKPDQPRSVLGYTEFRDLAAAMPRGNRAVGFWRRCCADWAGN